VLKVLNNGVAMGLGAVAVSLALSPACQASPAAVPAVYATKAEAEAAAKRHFHCSGAHKMGNQWMPCADHGTSPPAGHRGSQS
jgi:hypothetical protein